MPILCANGNQHNRGLARIDVNTGCRILASDIFVRRVAHRPKVPQNVWGSDKNPILGGVKLPPSPDIFLVDSFFDLSFGNERLRRHVPSVVYILAQN
jgi:hypothetical protein